MKKSSSLIKKAAKKTSEENRIALLNMLDDLAKEKKELKKKTKELKKEKTITEKSKDVIEKRAKEIEEQKTATMNILEDIEEAREKLKEQFKELKVLDKLKDEFANIGAHELKTPLVPIIGYLSLILKKKGSKISRKERQKLEICLQSALRLKNLVTDIAGISKLETKAIKFDMKQVKIENIVNDVVESLKPAAQQKHLEIVTNIEPKLPLINGDSERLVQALSKLVENAIKFTDKGVVSINTKLTDNHIKIIVVDTGAGLKKENIPKLFTKFYQADSSPTRRAQGTGLGLTICKEIILAHKGRVWAESKGLGKGSTFSFSLPVKR